MSKYLQIQIPKACHENWDKMDTAQQGRFCNSCQKNVIDFTIMSDNDLVNFFKKNKGNVCGRFTGDQLNTDIPVPSKKIPWLKYFFTITIPAFLFSQKTNAQSNEAKGKVVCVETKKSHLLGDIIFIATKTISGKVIDEAGKPVAGASVMVKNSSQGVATDSNGKFTLNLDPASTQLVISAIGTETQEADFKNDSFKVITLRSTPALKGEVVVIAGGVSRINKSQLFGYPVTKTICAKPLITTRKLNLNVFSIFPKPVSADPKRSGNGFTIFPNPIGSNSKLNIKWKNNISSDQSIEIHSVGGNLLQQEIIRINKKTNQQSIDLKLLPAGTYIIKVTDSKTHKFSAQQFIVE